MSVEEPVPSRWICESCGATEGQCNRSIADDESRCCEDCTHPSALVGSRL